MVQYPFFSKDSKMKYKVSITIIIIAIFSAGILITNQDLELKKTPQSTSLTKIDKGLADTQLATLKIDMPVDQYTKIIDNPTAPAPLEKPE
jgi:hypothetical protein